MENKTYSIISRTFGIFLLHFILILAALTVAHGQLLSLTKDFTDDPVAPGGVVTLEFTLTNASMTESAVNITFNDDLDAALAGLVSISGTLSDICGAGSQISGTDLLTFTGGNLAAGASCTFSVTLQVQVGTPPGTTATNTTSNPLYDMSGNPIVGNPASDDLHIDFLTFTKTFDGPTGATGTPKLTFTIQNLNPAAAATDLSFSDDLDGMVPGLVATNLPATDLCGPGSVLAGASFLTMTGGNLPPGGSCTFEVDLQVPGNAAAGTFLNTTSDLFSSGLTAANPATASLTVEPAPAFSKTFSPDSIGAGGTSTLTLTIDNTSSAIDANNLDFTDNLPAGIVIANPPNVSTTCTGGTVTAAAGAGTVGYTGGTAGAGSSCTVRVDVTGNTEGVYVNTTGNLTSSLGNSGTATDTLTVNPPPGFSQNFHPNPISPGGVSILTFTIDNSNSTLDANNILFTDNLPSGVEMADPSNASTSCTGGTLTAHPGTGLISYVGGMIAAGSTCLVHVDVTCKNIGTYENNTDDLTSSTGNSGAASDTLRVQPQSSLNVPTLGLGGSLLLVSLFILLALCCMYSRQRHPERGKG